MLMGYGLHIADGVERKVSEQGKQKKTNDAQLVLRIKKSERDRFVALCDELDTSAAREIRRFIRGFLAEHDDQG